MVAPYHKINSIYKRDNHGRFTDEWATDEIGYLASLLWAGEEKYDGTNTRLIFDAPVCGGPMQFGIRGRKEGSQFSMPVAEVLLALCEELAPRIAEKFPEGVTLYGETVGPTIQKHGENYGNTPHFVLFDVLVAPWWLKRDAVREVGASLGLPTPAPMYFGPLQGAVDFVKSEPKSAVGDFVAEGLVLRPAVELMDRGGNRIITKVKVKDYR